ncbi:MAG TPA: argininosuccinate lyase [Candidatus Omnitrophota bacterium]|nr:argininosuccinate lyase [Candidatus Omnitrophota bacterium]
MAKKLWGGRFKKETDKDFFEFQKSIQYDYKLALYDLRHSLIHISALKKSGILTNEEWQKLNSALSLIEKEIKENKFKPNLQSEDIHTEIQNRVEKKVGKLAQKLHTLRSRNDQIAFDEKNYCGIEACNIADYLSEVIAGLEYLSARYKNSQIPGYTHTRRAQKVAFADYLGAFEAMCARDKERLTAFSKKLIAYVGSGAFKGTSLSREYAAAIKEYLKSDSSRYIALVKNAPDNVSDRDFILEFLGILSILQMHLSRFAEDMILFSTQEFNFVDLPEEFCAGSSLMPHKKNPDFLELVRGYTGMIYGNLMALLTIMKGLPLTYNRDMQLDKEPLFSSVDIIKDELKILARFIKGIKLNEKVIGKALEDESLYAVDLAEYLVKEKKVPFAQAHEIIGKMIRYAEDNKCKIKDMEDGLLNKFSTHLNQKIIKGVFR